jgi:hypothetical protein
MIVNPAYYIAHNLETLDQICSLENARDAALKVVEEARDGSQDVSLERMKYQSCFSRKWKGKSSSTYVHNYLLGRDEKLAPLLAMGFIKSYGLDLTSCLPLPPAKRKRFKAYARYIGEVQGEIGAWVGVEV